jgi:acetyl esterase/lipase
VRVLYTQPLAFEPKIVKVYPKSKGGNACSCIARRDPVEVLHSVARLNLKHKIEKVIVHFHGGAFVCMSSFQHCNYTRQWCNMMQAENVIVFSVDYRLAPENPFPIPISDCF